MNENGLSQFRLTRRHFVSAVSALPLLSLPFVGRTATARNDAASIVYRAPYISPWGEVKVRLRDKVGDVEKAVELVYHNTTQNQQRCASMFIPFQMIHDGWVKLAVFSASDHSYLGDALARSRGSFVATSEVIDVPPGGLIGNQIQVSVKAKEQSGSALFGDQFPRGKLLVQAIFRDDFFRSTLPLVRPPAGKPVDQAKYAKRSQFRWIRKVEIMRSNILEIEN